MAPAPTSLPQAIPPAPPPPPAAPPVVEPEPPPPPAAEADPRKSPLKLNAWGRWGFKLQNQEEPKKLDHLSHDAEVDILFSAKIIEMVGITANLVGTYGPSEMGGSITGDINVMDLIAQLDFDDAFHVWAGRMLVPSDRTNFSGPWFIAPWYYPGFFKPFSAPAGPRQGPNGRNDGATIWGQAAGGTFKYYAGAYNLFDGLNSPLWSGRVSVSLLNPEPGYYGSSTFYGKDLLGIGLGVQAQKDGSGGDDYYEVNADILFEKDLGESGVLDVEGAFYKYEGDGEELEFSYFALASYLIKAKVGPGMFQPLVRYQGAKPTDEDADAWSLIDVQLGYVVEAYATRFALGFQHSDVLGVPGNNVFLGIQLQK